MDVILNILTNLHLQTKQTKKGKQYNIVMELQSVFNVNVDKNKQPDRYGNHSMVNINFWNIIFSHFTILTSSSFIFTESGCMLSMWRQWPQR